MTWRPDNQWPLNDAQHTRDMSLPVTSNEAALRALDRKCEKPDSAVYKRTVKQLAARLETTYPTSFLNNSTAWGLGNLVRCALEAGVSPETLAGEEGGMPILVQASVVGATAPLKALLAAGANTELANKAGFTALARAAQYGQLASVQLLLDAGANPNTQERRGHTPLMRAVAQHHVECVRALLPVCDLDLRENDNGFTAFHIAAISASEACVELLLPMMSDVNVRTVPGVNPRSAEVFNRTALHLACQTGQAPMCKALLSHGADRLARDSKQRTPLFDAAFQGHLSCVVLLVGRPGRVRMTPAEVDAVADDGWTALFVAASLGFEQICAVLLGAGARLDVKTSDGETPLVVAQRDHPTNAALLALLSGTSSAQPLGLVCDQCGKTAEEANGLKLCRDCQVVRYCSKECQAAAWPGHKAACKARMGWEKTVRPVIASRPISIVRDAVPAEQ